MGTFVHEHLFVPAGFDLATYPGANSLDEMVVDCLPVRRIGVAAMSMGPIPGAMVSEMFPQEARGLAASVVYAANSAFSILVRLQLSIRPWNTWHVT